MRSFRFAISICTAPYVRYILVRQVISTRAARYWAVPPKIDRRLSISTVSGQLREKLIVGGRLREKKGRRRRRKRGKEEKNKRRRRTYFPRDALTRASSRSSSAGAFSPVA
ncbi:hypothetical protein BHM03_00024401, partial [Ensete ventricosum]